MCISTYSVIWVSHLSCDDPVMCLSQFCLSQFSVKCISQFLWIMCKIKFKRDCLWKQSTQNHETLRLGMIESLHMQQTTSPVTCNDVKIPVYISDWSHWQLAAIVLPIRFTDICGTFTGIISWVGVRMGLRYGAVAQIPTLPYSTYRALLCLPCPSLTCTAGLFLQISYDRP